MEKHDLATSRRPQLRLKFRETLLSRPKIEGTRHAKIKPGPYSYIAAGSGIKGMPFVYSVRQKEGRVELWIDRGETGTNKEIFDRLHAQKKEIEHAFGGELSWHRLDDKRGCRVGHVLTPGGYRSDESQWPKIQEAMIEAMARLENALAPHLAKLKTELASEGS
jgi:hypothetical protein